MVSWGAYAQFSFHLIDNFEDGNYTSSPKWWEFGGLKLEASATPTVEGRDLISESCGDYALFLSGATSNWYVGGIGTDLGGMDATQYSRCQLDVYGSNEYRGKLVVELYEDDNGNYMIEQNSNYDPTADDKWVAEVNVQGKGWTRVSIPFTAFRDANTGVGDGIWNPDQQNGSGGLLKLQIVAIADKPEGKVNFGIDNILLTY